MTQNLVKAETPVTTPTQHPPQVPTGYYSDVVFLVIILSLLGLTPRQ